MFDKDAIIQTAHLLLWFPDPVIGHAIALGICITKVKPIQEGWWKAYIEPRNERNLELLRPLLHPPPFKTIPTMELLTRPEGRPAIYDERRVVMRLKFGKDATQISGMPFFRENEFRVPEFTFKCWIEFVNKEDANV